MTTDTHTVTLDGSDSLGSDVNTDSRYRAPALEKGLDILEALSETPHGLTLKQLADVLGRNVNQIFRMVVTLHQRGYIQADESDRYTLTLKMFRLAHRQPPMKSLIRIAQPLLVELAYRTRLSCHMALYQQGHVVVVAQAEYPERWSLGMKVGAIMGLTDTSSGHVLLAHQDEVERSRMLRNHVKVEGEADMDPGHLLSLLADVRRNGCAIMPSIQLQGITNVAAPVRGPDGKVMASVNVPHVMRLDKAPTCSVEQVKLIALEICSRMSEMLGAEDLAGVGGVA